MSLFLCHAQPTTNRRPIKLHGQAIPLRRLPHDEMRGAPSRRGDHLRGRRAHPVEGGCAHQGQDSLSEPQAGDAVAGMSPRGCRASCLLPLASCLLPLASCLLPIARRVRAARRVRDARRVRSARGVRAARGGCRGGDVAGNKSCARGRSGAGRMSQRGNRLKLSGKIRGSVTVMELTMV